MATIQSLVFLLLVPAIWASVSYDGYRTLRITVNSDEQHGFLTELTEPPHYDVWKEARGHGDHMDVMVTPENIDDFVDTLKSKGVEFDTLVDNVGEVLTQARQKREARTTTMFYDFSRYHTLSEIEGYLDDLKTNFSRQVTLFNVGTSYEGRTIRGAKISSGGWGRPAVWIDSCIHSREWIACATTQYIIHELLNNYASDPVVADLLDNIDIYYVPVVNVDGYEHTWTTDRLWRKTTSLNSGSTCLGTDPNRNWDFFWCESGSSHNVCSNSYCGSSPFSESEVSATAAYIRSIFNLQMYLSVHGFSQYYMVPWAQYTGRPRNYQVQMEACNAAIRALTDIHGTPFQCGTVSSFFGRTSGSSADWVFKNVPSVQYAFGLELRDKGRYGFELPEDQIVPSGEENYAAIIELLTTIRCDNL